MRLVRIVGADAAARETLATDLIAALARRGLEVSVVSRCAPDLAFDRPGKDSHAHRTAGARDVAVISAARYAIIREAPERAREASLHALLARMRPVDIVLALGFDDAEGELLRLRDGIVELENGRRFAHTDLDALASCLAA